MLALFATAIAILLPADLIVCSIARLGRIRQGLYDEQYCVNEYAVISPAAADNGAARMLPKGSQRYSAAV